MGGSIFSDFLINARAFWGQIGPYRAYVLFIFLVAFLINQLDRFTLPIVAIPVAQDLRYGDKGCLKLSSATADQGTVCKNAKESVCLSHNTTCEFNYNGQGFQYQVVAGTIFVLVYTFFGIPIGYLTRWFKRKNLLACFIIAWSVATILTGLVTEYWQLVILRLALGIGEAGCTPFAASMLSEMFGAEMRGFAIGVYNFGIYIGYSLSFAYGNFITTANILGQGWRWVFYLSGIPGILVGIIVFFTVDESKISSRIDYARVPATDEGAERDYQNDDGARGRGYGDSSENMNAPVDGEGDSADRVDRNGASLPGNRVGDQAVNSPVPGLRNRAGDKQTTDDVDDDDDDDDDDVPLVEPDPDRKHTAWQDLAAIIRTFWDPVLGMILLSGSIRNAGGYVWGFNTQPFFQTVRQQSPEQIGTYMSWIPLVAGCLGTLFGGFISDRFVKKYGIKARLTVLFLSQLAAAPFALMALLVPAPWCYISLIPSNIFGEMWIGVCLTTTVEKIPVRLRTVAVAAYLFVITNIGGNAPLLVPAFKDMFLHFGYNDTDSFRNSLIIMYPGTYALSSVLFALTIVVARIQELQHARKNSYTGVENTDV